LANLLIVVIHLACDAFLVSIYLGPDSSETTWLHKMQDMETLCCFKLSTSRLVSSTAKEVGMLTIAN
jgi:hypothetical protein